MVKRMPKGKAEGGSARNTGQPRAGSKPEQRLAEIETKAGMPNEVQDFLARLPAGDGKPVATAAERAMITFDALSSEDVAPVTVTDVIFELDPATKLKLVRVYEKDTAADIVSKAQPHGVLAQRIVGRFIDLVIQVEGAADDECFIKVRNATPNIRVKGKNGPWGIKSLFVTGVDE